MYSTVFALESKYLMDKKTKMRKEKEEKK